MRLPPALLAAPLLAGSAAAEPVAALRIDLPEAMSLRTRLAIERQAGDALTERGLSMITPGTVARKLRAAGAPSDCESGPCLSRVGEALGARAALIVEVDGVGDTYEVRVHARATAGGGDLASVVERCDECSTDELGKAVRYATGQAAEAIVKALPPPAPAAAPPANAPAPAGPAPGAATAPAAAIERAAEPEGAAVLPGYLKWVALGLGAGLLAVGVPLANLDSDCAVETSPGEVCPERYATGSAGMVLIGGGTFLALAGIELLAFGW